MVFQLITYFFFFPEDGPCCLNPGTSSLISFSLRKAAVSPFLSDESLRFLSRKRQNVPTGMPPFLRRLSLFSFRMGKLLLRKTLRDDFFGAG